MESTKSETAFSGRLFDVVVRTYRRADGSEYRREVVHHPGAVGVVAIDDEVLFLVRQPRESVGEAGLLEVPAGTLDVAGESRLACAQRELREEAGIVAESWEELRAFYPTPGWGDAQTTLFLATDLREVEPEPSAGERIEIVRWPLSELDSALAEAKDAKTLIALLLLRERGVANRPAQ